MPPRRPTHSQTRYRSLGRLLPRDSPMAQWMIPVATIRADLLVELQLIGTDDELIHSMVGSRSSDQEFHARSYFFRGTLRSLYSSRRVVSRLMGMPEFRALIDPVRSEFDELNSSLAHHSREFDDLRNEVGAHAEDSLAETRSQIDDDLLLAVERNDATGIVSANLANPFLSAGLFGREAVSHVEDPVVRERLGRMSDAGFDAFKLLDLILRTYLKSMDC